MNRIFGIVILVWVILLALTYLMLKRNRRPRMRVMHIHRPVRYRYQDGRSSQHHLYFVYGGLVKRKPLAVMPEEIPAEPEQMPEPEQEAPISEGTAEPELPVAAAEKQEAVRQAVEPEPRKERPAQPPKKAPDGQRRRWMFTVFAVVDVLVLCLVLGVLLYDKLPFFHKAEPVEAEAPAVVQEQETDIEDLSPEAQQAAEEDRAAEKEAAAATPTPVPTPDTYSNPLVPRSNLGDTGEYVEGTWMELRLQEEDNCYNPSMTLMIQDSGTGEQLYYQDRTPIDKDGKIDYCFDEPGRYIVTAFVTAGDGTESERLVMGIKIYADLGW